MLTNQTPVTAHSSTPPDDSWGLCPKCHGEPWLRHVDKSNFGTCERCMVGWHVGYNLFTTPYSWSDEDLMAHFGHCDRVRLHRDEVADLSRFRRVERPYFYSGPRTVR